MNILEFVARTLSPKLPDGRFIFRPWGARGPCFLLSARQRDVRAFIQLAFYCLMIGAIWFVPGIFATTSGLVKFFGVFLLLSYVLYWLFSIGLPRTDKPLPMTAAQRRTAMTVHSQAIGRPLLWIFAIGSWLFALGGAMVFLEGAWLTGLLGITFFGACGAIFTWQLRLIRNVNGS